VGQCQAFAGYEGTRQKNIFFAGEHTSLDYQGFMEGAAREGRRAAQEILQQLGRT
jgi:monoamine oxidase